MKCEWCKEEMTLEQIEEYDNCCCIEHSLLIYEKDSMESAGR